MINWIRATVVAAASMMVIAGTASTATAADPVSKFTITYGATVVTGKVTWHNRSVTVSGTVKVPAEVCRKIHAIAENMKDANSGTVGPFCSKGKHNFTINIPPGREAAGGFNGASVGVYNSGDLFLDAAHCERSKRQCEGG